VSPEAQKELDELVTKIAFPRWERRPDDTVETWCDWDKGYRYSEYTGEPASMSLTVTVKRADYDEYLPYGAPGYEENEDKRAVRVFNDQEVADLWGQVVS